MTSPLFGLVVFETNMKRSWNDVSKAVIVDLNVRRVPDDVGARGDLIGPVCNRVGDCIEVKIPCVRRRHVGWYQFRKRGNEEEWSFRFVVWNEE